MEAKLDRNEVRQWKRYNDRQKINHRWIDEMPSHWSKKRISYLFDVLGSGTTPNTSERRFYDAGNIPWVNTGDLNDDIVTITEKCVNETAIKEHSALKIYPDGTLLIALYGATIGKLGLLSVASTVNQACFAMGAPKIDVAPRYVLYWLLGNREHIVSMAYGGGQPNISGELIRSLRITVPPVAEQRAIAAFLDRETARIDALIARKQRLIELLEEKRQAVISQAVTKGFDSKVEMKPFNEFGVDSIPKNWKPTRLKYVTPEVTVGVVITPAKYYVQSGIVALRGTNVRAGMIREDDLVYFSDEGHRLNSKSILRAGDLVSVRSGQPGTTSVVPDHLDGINCIDLIIIRQSPNFDSDFLCYLSNSRFAKQQHGEGSDGAIQQHFNVETAKNMVVILPPLAEQRKLVNRLKDETGKIDQTCLRIVESIQRLQEYRTALISAAVTGQIDVREEVELDG